MFEAIKRLLGKKESGSQLFIDECDFDSGAAWIIDNLKKEIPVYILQGHIQGMKNGTHEVYKGNSESYIAGAENTLSEFTEEVDGIQAVKKSFISNPPEMEGYTKFYDDHIFCGERIKR